MGHRDESLNLKAKTAELEAHLKSLNRENERGQRKLKESEDRVSSLTQEVASLKAGNEMQAAKLEEDRMSAEVKARCDGLEKEIEGLRLTVKEKEGQIEALKTSATKAQEESEKEV